MVVIDLFVWPMPVSSRSAEGGWDLKPRPTLSYGMDHVAVLRLQTQDKAQKQQQTEEE